MGMHHDLYVIFDGPDESTYFSHFENHLAQPFPKFVSINEAFNIYVNSCDAEKALKKIKDFEMFENAIIGHFARKMQG